MAPSSRLERFSRCPIASRFIDNAEDAIAYYEHKLVGVHPLELANGAIVHMQFNAEEIHLFSTEKSIETNPVRMQRPGASEEIRYFSRDRARMLDEILPAIRHPAVVHGARDKRGCMLYGPVDRNARRLCVIVRPAGHVWFVRTAYPVTADEFRSAVERNRRSGVYAPPWPPK